MKSNRFFYFYVFALLTAVILCLSGCTGGFWISVPRTPTDVLADAISNGRSSLYVQGDLCYYALPIKDTYVDTSSLIKVINLKEFVALPSDCNTINFAAEPSSTPAGMYLKTVGYRLDQEGRMQTVYANYNSHDQHNWKFWVRNQRNGSHVLYVRFIFVSAVDENITATREVRLPIFMANTRWEGLTR